ncbi:MAG: GtrA family protein [Alphaproteobacteria bacterium]|nr:GtrA family protein [Alphaproteobacteria bacterium]
MKKLIELYLTVYQKWMQLPEKIRFLMVGGYNTAVSYIIYVLLVFFGLGAQMALLLSFFISSINSYFSQKFFVFATKGNYLKEYSKCLSTWVGSYILNAILLFLLMKTGLNAYIAEFIVLVILTVYSYVVLKYFAFKDKK